MPATVSSLSFHFMYPLAVIAERAFCLMYNSFLLSGPVFVDPKRHLSLLYLLLLVSGLGEDYLDWLAIDGMAE